MWFVSITPEWFGATLLVPEHNVQLPASASQSQAIIHACQLPRKKRRKEEAGMAFSPHPSHRAASIIPWKWESHISSPGWLCFHPRCCRLRHCSGKNSIPKLGAGNWDPKGPRQQLGMLHSFASLPARIWAGSYPAMGINWSRRERRLILTSM